MDNWNPEYLSESFLTQAREAERYCKEVKSKINRSPTYKEIFDEHLAKFHVFNYLYDRTFLATKEHLIKELKIMLTSKIEHSKCYDIETYDNYRKSYINQLISEFSD